MSTTLTQEMPTPSFSLGSSNSMEKKKFMRFMPSALNYFYADIKLGFDRANSYKNLKKVFKSKMKYDLNIVAPRSYNEKIIWKKLYDRNPLLTLTADKFAVRSYVKKILGNKEGEEILVPLYFATDEPEKIPFDTLPEKFILKPNHGSKMHMIVNNKNQVPKDFVIRVCKRWLKFGYGVYHYEWAYRKIKRKIVVEKLLESKNGELTKDYKLYCFHGKCKLVRVTKNRFDREFNSGYFDLDWNRLEVGVSGYKGNYLFDKPENLGHMVALAEKLSQPFDYVRVDLFDVDNKIYFGELTHYEASGMARLEPQTVDFELGKLWELKPEYWKHIK